MTLLATLILSSQFYATPAIDTKPSLTQPSADVVLAGGSKKTPPKTKKDS